MLYANLLYAQPQRFIWLPVIWSGSDRLKKGAWSFKLLYATVWPACVLGHVLVRSEQFASLERNQTWVGTLGTLAHRLYLNFVVGLSKTCSPDVRPRDWSKTYFRKVLVEQGAFVPPLIGKYQIAIKHFDWTGELNSKDLVIKPEYGGKGKGDCYLSFGQDFRTKQDVEEKLSNHMKQHDSLTKAGSMLILERIMPNKDFGLHVVMIITGKTKEGHVCVLHVNMNSGGQVAGQVSSHGCKDMYLLDPISEIIVGEDQWSTKPETEKTDPNFIGRRMPIVNGACALAVKTHRALIAQDPKALQFIGWDCMMAEDGSIVFFEGNPCGVRLVRCMCNSWASMRAFARTFF